MKYVNLLIRLSFTIMLFPMIVEASPVLNTNNTEANKSQSQNNNLNVIYTSPLMDALTKSNYDKFYNIGDNILSILKEEEHEKELIEVKRAIN